MNDAQKGIVVNSMSFMGFCCYISVGESMICVNLRLRFSSGLSMRIGWAV